MALAGRVLGRKEVPGESGEWFEFSTISGKQIDEARTTSVKAALDLIKGGTMPTIDQQNAVAPNPEDSYDKSTLVKYGVTAWSYTEPCTPENKDNLDNKTRDWAAHEVFTDNVFTQGEVQASDSR